MPSLPPSYRMLPGSTEGPYRPVESQDGGESITFRQVLMVLRRRYQLILAMTLVGASIGLFLASREPATYHAGAMLRFAGERQAITGDDEEPAGLPKHELSVRALDSLASKTAWSTCVSSSTNGR